MTLSNINAKRKKLLYITNQVRIKLPY